MMNAECCIEFIQRSAFIIQHSLLGLLGPLERVIGDAPVRLGDLQFAAHLHRETLKFLDELKRTGNKT